MMDLSNSKSKRRDFLVSAAAAIAGVTVPKPSFGQQTSPHTRFLTLGPFYPQVKPLDQDADMTVIKGGNGRAEGQIIHVAGLVINVDGKPLPGTEIDVWQADTNGRYFHASDPNPAKRDDSFQGFCRLRTDPEGRYRFKSVMPAPYPAVFVPGLRTPHIHFEIRGKTDRVVTQMFFPGEKLNEQDSILRTIGDDAGKATVTARMMPPTRDVGRGEILFGWNIVLLKG